VAQGLIHPAPEPENAVIADNARLVRWVVRRRLREPSCERGSGHAGKRSADRDFAGRRDGR
jgi:hypothetical protein